ncbi:MAG TPA: TonB-dependent hemoglobin/transferrin/lactoferrin family receptor [Alphaproteobacteria bacterium]|nr:TonB-dependent hemoglobin/transferrin/lactoferrin family receptor [Alphaproteobacteria bacterium]
MGSIAAGAAAQEVGRTPATVLDAVTSTATRNERAVRDVPGTVTVIDSEEIERRNVNNTRDLIRYEPGVSVSNSPTRAGRGNYVIRGIGENRVLLTVDGVRVPDFPANSQPGTFTRDYIDLESVKRVEIVRGPASALYGSDAIGGVVAYVTKDPADYLGLVGKDWYISGKGGFDSADTSFTETATAAGRSGPVEALLLATRRDGSESEIKGSLSPNPQDYDVNNLLGKLVFRVSDVDRLRFTGEFTERHTDTDIRSELGAVAGVPGTFVTDSKGDDYTRRRRLSLDHAHDAPIGFVDRVLVRASYQEVDRTEHSDQFRLVGASRRLRVTDQAFSQDITSFDLQLESNAEFGLSHRFTYGFDVDFTNTTRPRDRTEFNLTTGTSTKSVAGETFPTKTFPDTETVLGGFYLQDEMKAMGDRLIVIPAVRFDYYSMKPSPDRAFLINSPGISGQVSDVSETAVSPKLGAVYKLTDIHSVFAQYAHGFRSPPYDDANIGFTNAAFGYQILPNPDLKPETSDGFELGLRGGFKDGSSYQLAAFYTLYKDFIEQRSIGTGPTGLLQFQSRNLDEVEIYGAEAKGDWRITNTVSLLGAVAYARGTDKQTGLPVDSVDPLKLVAGVRYEDPKDWGVEFVGTTVARKSRNSDPAFFQAPGFAVFDLLGHYDIGTGFSINAGIFNIFDKKYWIAQDVVGVAASNPQLDLFTQPGTTFAVNAVLRW